ncbi:Na+/H+ antiporter [Novosphingobium terrae]|uniref:Na+/H+ antiporter n=1 Tax=Novosphingobium terrae TaxID=2726189 RepID=UPI00197FDFA4|nr:Na+/H+ antiporter [Novosphingobium terrae]
MEIVSIVLFFLLAVVVSGAISRMLPVSVPTPLVQIVLGAVIGLSAAHRVELDPDLFLLLFLPPLLFLDGWRIPKDALFKDVATVTELAFGLVLMTVVGVGFLAHWLIPAMPLAVGLALASVISPTDPIAVSAIAARVPFPRRLMHILEGESLLNDASGLVCLRFAVAAALTGSFSASSAILSFLWTAGIGLAAGAAVTLGVSFAMSRFTRRWGEDIGAQILVSLLIPFGAYQLAEHLHASGILAAVSAGVTMTFAEISRQAMAATRMRRNSVWDMIQFTLNGVIFVLLGEQLPAILGDARHTVAITGHDNPWWLGLYTIIIVAALAGLRLLWVVVSLKLTLLKRRRQGVTGPKPQARLILAMSFAGVRGAITLAGVMTLPLTLHDGTPFPARDLAIFLSAGVILLSMLVASVALPVPLKGLDLPPEPSEQAEEDSARIALAEAAIRAVERQQKDWSDTGTQVDLYAEVGGQVVDAYRERIEGLRDENPQTLRNRARLVSTLHLVAVKAQRQLMHDLLRERRIGSEIARKLTRELDLVETRHRG